MKKVVDELVRMEDINGSGSLQHVYFNANRNEITGLLGLNHSGKVELMNILCGFVSLQSGRIYFENESVNFYSPLHARDHGICCINNENALIDDFTVAENIFIRQIGKRSPIINHRQELEKCNRLLFRIGIPLLGIDISAEKKIRGLSLFEKMVVMIIRAVASGYKLIVLDRLFSNLSRPFFPLLHALLSRFLEEGLSFILVDHNIPMLLKVCDRITVLREGQNAGTFERIDFDNDVLTSVMIGNQFSTNTTIVNKRVSGKNVLEMEKIILQDGSGPLTFEVHEGESIGLYSFSDSFGRQLTEGLYGISPFAGGVIRYKEKPVRMNSSIRTAMKGLGLVSDWNTTFENMNEVDNLTIQYMSRSSKVPGSINFHAILKSLENPEMPFDDILEISKQRKYSAEYKKTIAMLRNVLVNPDMILYVNLDKDMDILSYHRMLEIIKGLTQKHQAILMVSGNIHAMLPVCSQIYLIHEGHVEMRFDTEQMSYESIVSEYNRFCANNM